MTPLLLALLAPWTAHALDAPVTRHALLVGANDGGAGRVVLRYAWQDARAFGQVLMDLGGVPPEQRTTLFDPSRAQLFEAFDALKRDLSDDPGRSEVVFYYSGHSDETGLLLGKDLVRYDELRAALDALDAEMRVAVLDSCASGAMVRGKGGRAVPGFMLDTSSTVEGYAYITSAAADEAAQEADRIEGSYFTWFLTTGLRGAADRSGDGRVTLHEAYDYAFDQTLERTVSSQHGPQHASYDFQLAGSGDLVLTDLALTSATLILAEGFAGRAYVRDGEGHLVAEVAKPTGREIELGLAPGAYEVVVADDAGNTRATVRLEKGDVVTLSPGDLVATEIEVAVARGGGASPLRERVTHVGLLPYATDAGFRDRVALNVGVGRSGELDGLAIGFGANVVDGRARGGLLTLGANAVGGELDGFQGSMGFNHAGAGRLGQVSLGANSVWRDLRGSQWTLGGNVVGGDLRGVQVALGGNVARGNVGGVQGGLGLNVAGRSMTGVQLGMGVNVVRRDMTGVQGGGLNLAGRFSGVQVGLLNIGGDVTGAQVGLINVATGRVVGTQIGVVNYADRVRGLPIGLVSVVRDGRSNVSVFATETDPANLDLKLGSRAAYTVLGIGGRPQGDRQAYASLGFGVHARTGRVFTDVEVAAASYFGLDDWTVPPTPVFRGRALVGVHLAERLAVFGGPQVSVKPVLTDTPLRVAPAWIGGDPLVWGGVVGGVQF